MALLKCNMLVLPLIFKIGAMDHGVLNHFLSDGFNNDVYFTHYDPKFLEHKTRGWQPPYWPENQTLIAFCVISGGIAKSPWFYDFEKKLIRGKFYRVYKIILDRSTEALPLEIYSIDEQQSFVFKAVYSYFKNSNAEGAACRRVIELMNRIMGVDLPRKDFPDFDIHDQARIAWHTNRENFNWDDYDEPRKNTIKKYKIVNDVPAFAIKRL